MLAIDCDGSCSNPDKNRKNAAASSHHRRSVKGAQAPQPPADTDLINLSPTNLPLDDFQPEKEVCEEKEYPAVSGGGEGGGESTEERGIIGREAWCSR